MLRLEVAPEGAQVGRLAPFALGLARRLQFGRRVAAQVERGQVLARRFAGLLRRYP